MKKSIYDLPSEIGKEISGHLPSIKAKTNAILDKHTRTLFQPPAILSKFLEFVAHGKQDHAEKIFTIRKKNPHQLQELLLERGTVTDYSGRTFTNISAYEYAYWAKDKHMCRMLESHMDENTKAAMLKRCEAIESNGLTYKQHGVEVKNSKHFDLTPLKTALNNYIDGYDNWESSQNCDAMKAAWMEVGKEQRDVPVHVANEYCRKDRSFDPTPQFNEDKLPRKLAFHNYNTNKGESWFPLVISDSSGLAVDFALIRAGRGVGAAGPWGLDAFGGAG
ncbi:hypothetical protein [Legionella antarctica]|nr:hypothetical protein [Legionella antarctica]